MNRLKWHSRVRSWLLCAPFLVSLLLVCFFLSLMDIKTKKLNEVVCLVCENFSSLRIERRKKKQQQQQHTTVLTMPNVLRTLSEYRSVNLPSYMMAWHRHGSSRFIVFISYIFLQLTNQWHVVCVCVNQQIINERASELMNEWNEWNVSSFYVRSYWTWFFMCDHTAARSTNSASTMPIEELTRGKRSHVLQLRRSFSMHRNRISFVKHIFEETRNEATNKQADKKQQHFNAHKYIKLASLN